DDEGHLDAVVVGHRLDRRDHTGPEVATPTVEELQPAHIALEDLEIQPVCPLAYAREGDADREPEEGAGRRRRLDDAGQRVRREGPRAHEPDRLDLPAG